MSNDFLQLAILTPILCLIQVLAALPWLGVIDPELVRVRFRNGPFLLKTLGVIVAVGVVIALYLDANKDPEVLAGWGRLYSSVLQIQLTADLLIALIGVALLFWPKGGAVALSSFREGVRQPMFWVLTIAGVLLLGASPFLPYFTFGEDQKMLKDLGFITIMFVGALFGVLNASMSISEEIEGRTAITVMSKPISRRNFLLGKFLGILLSAALMTALLGWLLVWVLLFKEAWDPPIGRQVEPDPSWVISTVTSIFPIGPASDLGRGIILWISNVGDSFPGLVITFCQVMILIAIAVSLATRVPMIVNVLVCLAVYFLGHLTPVLTAVSDKRYPLIEFFARVFDTVLPGLDSFDMGPAVVRYAPLPPAEFAMYTVYVVLYAVMYTAVALLLGLILFEDRDLA